MCGVVGIMAQGLANDKEVSLFKGLLLVDQIRGEHATGVIKVNTRTNEVLTHKRAMNAVDFLAEADTKKFLDEGFSHIYIGHNRYATMGDKAKHDNAHPFQHDHITLVHNGGVDPFGLDLLEGFTDAGVDVDSHMVCMTIAKHGVKKAVTEHLSGAFALVWWDSKEKSLNFIRNVDRPLYMGITTAGALVWASEKGMLDVYLKRSGRNTGYRVEPILIPTDTLHTFKFDDTGARIGNAPTMTEMEFVELTYPKSTGVNETWWGNSYYGTSSSTSQRSESGNAVAEAAHANKTRVNNNLEKEGCRLRHGSMVTFDITTCEPYATNAEFGVVYGTCRDTQKRIQAWGIAMAAVVGVTTLRGIVTNAYGIMTNSEANKFVICVEQVGISCHDPKYSSQNSGQLLTLSNRSTQTSRGNDEAKIAAEKVIELRKNAEQKDKPRMRIVNNVHYPLKAQGHTFTTAEEFREFVAKGCATCNSIPTAYDSRNTMLTVYEGTKFNGLLDDCEFVCGKCEEI